MTWISPKSCLNELQFEFSAQLERRQKSLPHAFPDLRTDGDLVLAVDHSGEHKGAAYGFSTFLLADRPGILASWELKRQQIRDEFLTDRQRHSFKHLGDGQRQRALLPFLKASSKINGIVLSVAFERSIEDSLFGFNVQPTENCKIKNSVVAKTVRSALFGSMLIGGLARDGQCLKWISDDDSTFCNESVQEFSLSVIGSMISQCCPFETLGLSFGIASKFDDGLRAEDLCSIPDLVGGALSELMNDISKSGIPKSAPLYTPSMRQASIKSSMILAWRSDLNASLKHVFCLVRRAGNRMRLSFGDPTVSIGGDMPRQLWVPPDRKWMRNLKP